jgi:outer membrane protein
MGEIPGAMTANLGITTRFSENWINFNANAYVATTHRKIGNRLTFGMVLPSIKVGSEKFDLDAQWTYGDAKYNQTHFGVSQRQSQQSPFKAYTAKAGLNEIRITAAWLHVWNRHWSIRSSIAGIHLLNDAAKSPIVSRKTMPMIVTTVNYAF